jgi:DNA mismatch repair protein PMS2
MIKKSDFQSLKIHGQFNLGFILVSFKEYMFIIDQHASDEKSRYEMYCRSKITTQPLISYLILIRPQRLEMTPQQEYELSTRVDVVRDAGFDVRLANGKWYLVGVPQTQGMLLNQDDLFEFLVLQPGQLCTKLKKLYASKACRSAVMIGDVLTKKQMQEIVLKMGELDSPWNCPHGRPTMRLLCKLT